MKTVIDHTLVVAQFEACKSAVRVDQGVLTVFLDRQRIGLFGFFVFAILEVSEH